MSDKYIAYPNSEKYYDGQIYTNSGDLERTEKFFLGNKYIVGSQVEPYYAQRQEGREQIGEYFSRMVIEGDFTYPNGKASGTVKAFTIFTARYVNGSLRGEGVQRYSIKPGIINSNSEIYTYLSTPSALKGDWYYEWGDMNVASDKENAVYLPAPVYTDRAKLNELPGADAVQIFFKPSWYQQIFDTEPSWSSGLPNGGGQPGGGGAANNSLQLFVSDTQVNEGSTVTTRMEGTPGQTLYYRVTGNGVRKKDFASGALKGSLKADANGMATISHTLRADKRTEGDESFAIQVFSDKKMRNPLGQSDAITAFDTSVKSTKSKGGGKKDVITGNWTTENGILLDIDITSGNTPYKKYFAVAEEIIDVLTARYRNYGDANNNGQFDPTADKPLGEWTVRSQDGIPYYVGTFTYQNGTFNATSGVFDVPVNPFE